MKHRNVFQRIERHIEHPFLEKANDRSKHGVRSPGPTAGMVEKPKSLPMILLQRKDLHGWLDNMRIIFTKRYIILQAKEGNHVCGFLHTWYIRERRRG